MALACIGSGALIGAVTNAVNGAVSPTYFRTILGWHDVENIGRAAIAQGLFEGLIYGAIFALLFTAVVGTVSRVKATFGFALRPLLLAVVISLIAWCLGGIAAIGLASLSPEFYRNTFLGVPRESAEMLKYAWVGGSIWGVMLGGPLSLVIVPIVAASSWRRQRNGESARAVP